ncbi:MAG: CPCC family cysteine-rich protein [Planctomycetota bacterium]
MDDGSKHIPSPEELAHRLAWFNDYAARLDGQSTTLPLRCPCCGCRTLDERGGFDICKVCFWEDDGQDDFEADVVRGGPNGSLSLSEARANYLRVGACEERMVVNVRPPRPEELPDQTHV